MKQKVVKGKEEKEGVGAPKCYNCCKRGHKKFECPNKVVRVTLKHVDAQTVAEGMCEIFSRTGIPNELLTDQGTGKSLVIDHRSTSASH